MGFPKLLNISSRMRNLNKGKHVVIMGGGLAGFAAAHELSRAKFRVTVVEKLSQVGGLAQTVEKKGF